MTVGIVLAGGKATRLPNKPLLPLKTGRPVITSGLDLFVRSQILRCIVVVPPDSVLVDIVPSLGLPIDLAFAVQEEPDGVPHAISCSGQLMQQDERGVVVCCDNVFPDGDVVPDVLPQHPEQQVRDCPPWKAMHLSRYDGQWSERGIYGKCVAGWLTVSMAEALRGAEPDIRGNMCRYLEAIEARPQAAQAEGWWDIGIAGAYARYWRTL
jgi:hypothetical protein